MKTYTFHISLAGGEHTWRKIELRADQTLEELHFAIQAAYGWKAEHLYSFFLSGKAWDEESEYTLPREGEWAEAFQKPLLPRLDGKQRARIIQLVAKKFGHVPEITGEVLDDLQRPAGGPGDVRTTRLETLSLEVGQEFLYLFDYADERRCTVRVEAIRE